MAIRKCDKKKVWQKESDATRVQGRQGAGVGPLGFRAGRVRVGGH